MKEFVLIYDVPREPSRIETKVWRDLIRLGAKKLQHSVWTHGDLPSLMDVATFVKKSGGEARILEERFVF